MPDANTSEVDTQRAAFYLRAESQRLAPLWTRLKTLVPAEPTPTCAAHCWHYADVRPYVMESAEQISAAEAERRVLITAHDAFNYLGRRYGFEVLGIQGMRTESEAGLKRVEALVDLLVEQGSEADRRGG